MGRAKHRLSVHSYPKGTKIYRFADDRGEIYFYVAVTGDRLSEPIPIIDESDEFIMSSKVKDNYGNRDCYHTFSEFDAHLYLHGISNLTAERAVELVGPRIYYSINGKRVFSNFIPGKAEVNATNAWFVITYIDDNWFEKKFFVNGDHTYTYSAKLTIIKHGPYPWSTKTATIERGNKYTPIGKSKYYGTDWKSFNTIYISPLLVGTIEDDPPSADVVKALLNARPTVKGRTHFVPDNIVDNIYEKLTIPNVNNIENLKDLKEIRKSIPPIINLLKRRNFKSLAEFYLWYKYTYRTTCMDLRAYYDFFHKWYKESLVKSDVLKLPLQYQSVLNTDGVVDQTLTRYGIFVDPVNIGVLKSLGLELNLSNSWDVVPFSFVVDWFINLGDIFSRLDHIDEITSLSVRTVVSSTKRTLVSIPLSVLHCTSPCTINYYNRTVDHVIPLGKLAVSLKNPGTHLMDGTALYVALKKR